MDLNRPNKSKPRASSGPANHASEATATAVAYDFSQCPGKQVPRIASPPTSILCPKMRVIRGKAVPTPPLGRPRARLHEARSTRRRARPRKYLANSGKETMRWGRLRALWGSSPRGRCVRWFLTVIATSPKLQIWMLRYCTPRARARGRATKPLEPRGSAGFVVADTPRAARGCCWEMQPLSLFDSTAGYPANSSSARAQGLVAMANQKGQKTPREQSPALSL